ncbi:hypothetical protein QBC38DRAFT_458481 [Podospora fimiseda]|uniref:Uncharacterized protein n=1 Tax=Podospora fimiseda TaxID=252190 RepID=A0AAN7BJ85_9PEZI|nr:hypothetical protein QBC38DRAFT_458481 [Podospora fimiseda]
MVRNSYECFNLFYAIKNGTAEFEGVTNETLWSTGWEWTGPIARLKSHVPRDTITAMTYQGCLKLCGAESELNTPAAALILITTWIFPLSIIFSLPYDSLHEMKLWGTLGSVSNWLGSPQTAMTAATFNFDQIRDCHRRAGRGLSEDTYYILSCFNQFLLPKQSDSSELDGKFVATLIYGLFRPLRDGNLNQKNLDIEYTRQLVGLLASQLRILRRRGVIPMMLSLGTFLVAAIISVYLAFGDAGEGPDSTSLTFGLVYCWVPMLVICTIIDRNPVSSDRTRELMSRWLFNVEAVRQWKIGGAQDNTQPVWWRGTRGPNTNGQQQEILLDDDMPDKFKVGEFIGQGRQMHYCGLTSAVLSCSPVEPEKINDNNIAEPLGQYERLATRVLKRLKGRRPREWWISAFFSFFLVMTPLFMAFLTAFVSPTAGIGCWSGSILMFAILSSVNWVVSLCNASPGLKMRIFCYLVNLVAILFLLFFTGLVLSGATNNCYCNTTWFAYPTSGGYMTFDSSRFVRDNYNVKIPCICAAACGFTVTLGFFFFEAGWWLKCKHLWKTNERDKAISASSPVQLDTFWLQ